MEPAHGAIVSKGTCVLQVGSHITTVLVSGLCIHRGAVTAPGLSNSDHCFWWVEAAFRVMLTMEYVVHEDQLTHE